MLNGFERVNAALNGEPVDKIPIMLHNFMLAAAEMNVSMGQYRENPRLIADCFIHSVEKYGLDSVFVDIDTATLAGSVGVPVQFPENEPARYHGACLNSLSEVKNLKRVNIENYKYVQNWLEAVRLLKEHFGNEVYVRGNCDPAPFSLACSMRGINDFMLDLLMEEESLVKELLEYATDITSQFIRLMAQTGADMVSNGDSNAGPELVSAEMYEKFALPYETRIVEEAHKEGLAYTLHICGNVDDILDKMVLTGADAFEIDYKTNMHKAYNIFHDKATFIGNIDPSGVLAMGTPEMVYQKTIELLDVFRNTNRFILNAGCAIPSSTPEINIRNLLNAARDYKI
ncbi:hypothetical protein E9993_18525 [Labilibacter sediminis]|nr:hypothetical protein E9993_18525 [Labilibacter sediminis]